MNKKPIPMAFRTLHSTMNAICDICWKARAGSHKNDHTECSKIRQARGF